MNELIKHINNMIDDAYTEFISDINKYAKYIKNEDLYYVHYLDCISVEFKNVFKFKNKLYCIWDEDFCDECGMEHGYCFQITEIDPMILIDDEFPKEMDRLSDDLNLYDKYVKKYVCCIKCNEILKEINNERYYATKKPEIFNINEEYEK